jgi:magnesium chelatase family protein
MSTEEILECSMIASVAGYLSDGKLQQMRPYRAPHHSCTMPAMVGGGGTRKIYPGEISLAHNGVLFLDELPEFNTIVLDALRQPMETGELLISRAANHVTFPSRFLLIAAMNPCRCGYLSDADRACNQAPRCATTYQSKISGPIMDRIDIHIEIPSLTASDLQSDGNRESSAKVAARVARVREIQAERYQGYAIRTNSELDGELLIEIAFPNDNGKDLLNDAVDRFKLSMRGYNRILRLARTIADMEESQLVKKYHIAEALSYRQLFIKKAS